MNITQLKKAANPFYVYRNRQKVIPYARTQLREVKETLAQSIRRCEIPLSKDDWQLLTLKNKYQGKRCFILGNGPSLKIEDLDKLKNEITFASNKIYLAFDKTDWRPTYYSVYDILVAQYNMDVIQSLTLSKIFGKPVQQFSSNASDIIYIDDLPLPESHAVKQFKFSTNLLLGAYGGYTVIYLQLQLAYWMGMKEVYLIGVDFHFTPSKDTGEKTSQGEVILQQGNESNHFHQGYRHQGERWTLPRLDYQYQAFLCAKNAFKEAGGHIYNASRQTALDVFPLVNFTSLIQ